MKVKLDCFYFSLIQPMGNKNSWEQSTVVADLRSLEEDTKAIHAYISNPYLSLDADLIILQWINCSKDKSAYLHFELKREVHALKRRIEKKQQVAKLNKSP